MTFRRLLLVFTGLITAGCESEVPSTATAPAESAYIVAVNNPLYFFARTLAADSIEVRLPAPSGIDPAHWEPTAEDLVELSGAALILLNSEGYSPWVDKLAIAGRKLVETTDAESLIPLEAVTHSHGPQGEHAHGGYAGTTWMDFSQAAAQATAVARALETLLPDQVAAISGRLTGLHADLEALDQGFQRCTDSLSGRQLIYSHPVYQYFERRYQLPGRSLHWEPDLMPTDDQWQALGQMLRDGALFVWEARPSAAIAEAMGAMGVASVVLDPGANRTTVDWLTLQRASLARLETICSGSAA